MCGRFANPFECVQEWNEHFFGCTSESTSVAGMGYNTAPTQNIPVITKLGTLVARWGFVPPWVHQVTTKFATHNARAESISQKPTFRSAWSNGQRCIIPAIGYYEWKLADGGKHPYFVTTATHANLAFAGIYEPARGSEIPASCAIVTMPASQQMVGLHPRMPAMLDLEQSKMWLNCQIECDAVSTLEMQIHQVSTTVNSTKSQGVSLILQIAH